MIDSFNQIFADKNKILVVMAHPDDAEIYAGGTIARLVDEKKEVQIVEMSIGSKGSRQNVIPQGELQKIREREDEEAMKILGVKEGNAKNMMLMDGSVEDNHDTIERIVRKIRSFGPELIITHNPENVLIRFDENASWVNHRDHMNTAKAAIYAAYPYSRDILFFPDHFVGDQMKSHTTTEFLIADSYDHPDEVSFDITATAERKTKAIAAHPSQHTEKDAWDYTNFLCKQPDGKFFERFRYVNAD